MTIQIDEIQTEVQVGAESGAAGAAPAPEPPWQPLARLRTLQQVLKADDARTAASGNDD